MGTALVLMLVGCASRIGDQPGSSVTTTTAPPSSTTRQTTTAATTTTSLPPPVAQPEPGSACVLGSDPDCIDPDGDGQGTYLVGGAECVAGLGPELCADLDGDGVAGYPDSG